MSFKKTLIAAGLLAASTLATAVPITGGISFTGFGSPFVAGEDTSNATQFDFMAGPNAVATTATGDFAGLYDLVLFPGDAGDTFTFHDFSFNPVVNPTLVWSANTGPDLSFYIQNGSVSFGATALTLTGLGFVQDNLTQEQAIGSFTITANEAGGSFSWSSSTAAVSEPGTIALLGLGLAGLGFARRKQAKAA